jgi:nucleotide-binding universal stress UspA family protein
MTGSIICGIDGSESARGAARVARAISRELGLGVIFVHVVEPNAPAAKVRSIAERLERLSSGVNAVDRSAGWSVETGHPADGLVSAAKNAGASLIVVGSTGPRSSLLGSVSADVSRRAPCPVVVVPPGADHNGGGDGEPGTGDTEFAGGLVRFGLGDGGTEFAGGIARFGLGARGS